jgi:Ca2+-binding RTX toxin-like protein
VWIDLYSGGGDGDTFTSIENVVGSAFEDVLLGDAGNNTLFGLDGVDLLGGQGGDDILVGGAGADVLDGGFGADVYFIDNASDAIVEAANDGASDSILTSANYSLNSGVYVETLSAADPGATTALRLAGHSLADAIIGNAGDNFINGAAGSDTLTGLGGNDILMFPAGAVIASRSVLAMMSESKPLAVSVTLPDVLPPLTDASGPAGGFAGSRSTSLRKIEPRVVNAILPEVSTWMPFTSSLRPPI